MSDRIIIKLTRPIEALGEEITELKLREPEMEDLEKCGDPMIIIPDESSVDGVSIKFNTAVITALIARLADIPRGSVRKMCIADYSTTRGVILNFFGEAGEQPPTASAAR